MRRRRRRRCWLQEARARNWHLECVPENVFWFSYSVLSEFYKSLLQDTLNLVRSNISTLGGWLHNDGQVVTEGPPRGLEASVVVLKHDNTTSCLQSLGPKDLVLSGAVAQPCGTSRDVERVAGSGGADRLA